MKYRPERNGENSIAISPKSQQQTPYDLCNLEWFCSNSRSITVYIAVYTRLREHNIIYSFIHFSGYKCVLE